MLQESSSATFWFQESSGQCACDQHVVIILNLGTGFFLQNTTRTCIRLLFTSLWEAVDFLWLLYHWLIVQCVITFFTWLLFLFSGLLESLLRNCLRLLFATRECLGNWSLSLQTTNEAGWEQGVPAGPVIRWLGLQAFTVVGVGSVSSQGTKILQVMWCQGKKEKWRTKMDVGWPPSRFSPNGSQHACGYWWLVSAVLSIADGCRHTRFSRAMPRFKACKDMYRLHNI